MSVSALISSYQRVLTVPGFGDCFYRRFLAGHPEVARRFAGVDMARQKFLLQRSLTLMMQHAAGREGAGEALAELARRHGPEGMDIPEFLYGVWVDALVGALEECDPCFEAGLEAEWRNLLDREVMLFIGKAAGMPGWRKPA